MKFTPVIAAALVSLLLAGCAGASVGLHTSSVPSMRGSAPAPGASYSSAAIHAEAGSNALFSLLFLGYVAAGMQDDRPGWRYGPVWRAPPLAEDRNIAERDCSQPFDATSANLRCR